eukprot:scaffold1634_cov353-Prasinococcus_capsulatus_cf.AAC.5
MGGLVCLEYSPLEHTELHAVLDTQCLTTSHASAGRAWTLNAANCGSGACWGWKALACAACCGAGAPAALPKSPQSSSSAMSCLLAAELFDSFATLRGPPRVGELRGSSAPTSRILSVAQERQQESAPV